MQLKRLENPIKYCKICFKKISDYSLHNLHCKNNDLCEECFAKFQPKFINYKINEVKAMSLYEYDETLKDLIFKYKGCFDIELKSVFTSRYLLYLKLKYFGYKIVTIPSYITDDRIRGFNHVEEIAKLLNLQMLTVLEKTEKIKQADLGYKDRQKIGNILSIKNKETIYNQKILLMDDICTTGASLKAASKLILECKPKKLQIFTIAKNVMKRTQ